MMTAIAGGVARDAAPGTKLTFFGGETESYPWLA